MKQKKGNKRLFIHRTKRGALFSLTVCSNREISLMNPYLHLHVPGWIALKMKSFLSNKNTYEHGGIKISMKNGSQTKLVFEISNAWKWKQSSVKRKFTMFKQLLAQEQWKKRWSRVPSVKFIHSTQSKLVWLSHWALVVVKWIGCSIRFGRLLFCY